MTGRLVRRGPNNRLLVAEKPARRAAQRPKPALFADRESGPDSNGSCPVESGRTHLRAVFLSIKPWWAEAILSGQKTVELRKAFAADLAGCPMYLYATAPRQCVVGRVLVESVEELPTADLWSRHGAASTVTRREFDDYYKRRATGTGVSVVSPVQLLPLALTDLRQLAAGFRPPMSYLVLAADDPVRQHLATLQSLLD